MFLQMLLAQAERSAAKERILAQVKEGKPGAGLLQFAEVMYDATTEIMRYVEDQDFLGIQNAYIRTDYGVVLANLGRFSEAHRRLNEATGYLRCSPKNGDLLAWSVADLRRAEVYLREAESHVGEAEEDDKVGRAECGTYKRSHAVVCIDSAYAALRQAESRVIGQPRETWWLTWMHELDLWVCELLTRTRFCPPRGKASHASHVCRRCMDPYQRVNEVVEKALRLIRYDVFRMASLGDVVQRIHEYKHLRQPAREAISRVAGKLDSALNAAREARRDDQDYKDYPLHPTVETYVQYIADRLRDCL